MAVVGGVVLAFEAVVFVLLNLFLGMVVDQQEMSLAGIDPRATTLSAWIAGGVFGVYLLVNAAVLLRAAVTDRPPRGFWRIVLISCAVVHGLLGAFSVGLVGWQAFAVMMVVLALIVWALTWYPAKRAGAETPERSGDGAGEQGPSAPPAPGTA